MTTFQLNEFLASGAIMGLPNHRLLIGWGNPCCLSTAAVDESAPAFFFSDFFLRSPSCWFQYPHSAEISRDEFQELLPPFEPASPCEWSSDPEKFRHAYEELMIEIENGVLHKAVPYIFTRSSSLMDTARLQNSLLSCLAAPNQQAGSVYGMWSGSSGILGVTPELLFTHSSRHPQWVQTMALAGTCPLDRSLDDFLKSEKELVEHQLVVEGICETLAELGNVEVGSLQLLRLPKLSHLLTPIDIVLNRPFHFETLVKSLHPTPALGAFPRSAGKQWLENFDRHSPRSFYGAPVGYQTPSSGLSGCYVGIRNVQWDPLGMRIGAGCGVIKQSQLEQEWQEIQLKIKSIRGLLSL